MTAQLTPYLKFDGDAREALDFYQEVFGGTLANNTFAEFGETGPFAERIMHGQLETDGGWMLMASDMTPDMPSELRPGRVDLFLNGDDAATLTRWFGMLSEGGTVQTPLSPQVWGDTYGACTDRFGVQWFMNIDGAAQEA